MLRRFARAREEPTHPGRSSGVRFYSPTRSLKVGVSEAYTPIFVASHPGGLTWVKAGPLL